MDLLKQFNKEGMTMIQAANNQEFAGCDKRIVILDGGLIEEK